MEIISEIDGTKGVLRGVIHQPIGDPKAPVLFIHGYFSSTRIGPARLYVQLSRLIESKGYLVYRFDSFGVGDSDGKFIESTYSLRLRDYALILQKIANNENLSHGINIVSHSMGGSLAIRLAYKFPYLIKRIILISPSVGEFAYIHNLFEQKQLLEIESEGRTIRKGYWITRDFMKLMESNDIYKIATKINPEYGSTIIYGTNDEFSSTSSYILLGKKLQTEKIIAIQQADHNFINLKLRQVLFSHISNIFEENN